MVSQLKSLFFHICATLKLEPQLKMTSLITQKKKRVSSELTSEQKTFNRLKKKVEKLRLDIKIAFEELDKTFKFYQAHLLPSKNLELNNLINCTKLVYNHYKNLNPAFPKKDKKFLKAFIILKTTEILSSVDPQDADPEICAILKDLEGVDYHEEVTSQLNVLKKEMERMCKKQGVDVDLSSINDFENEYDLRAKIFEAIDEAREKTKDDLRFKAKQKTKYDIEKEKKTQELENLQKKGLSTIYKQLAKVMHPDLEQDVEKKTEKEMLMKRLTHAYDTNDLHALLALKIECMSPSEDDKAQNDIQNNEQLNIFNSILKKQVDELQQELSKAFMHPKYLSIQEYLNEDLEISLLHMKHDLQIIKEKNIEYQKVIKNLSGNNPLPTLKALSSLQKYYY